MRLLSFDPEDANGAPRVFAGMHRQPWDKILNEFRMAGPDGYHNPSFGNVGIYDPEGQLRRAWANGDLDRVLYEVENQ